MHEMAIDGNSIICNRLTVFLLQFGKIQISCSNQRASSGIKIDGTYKLECSVRVNAVRVNTHV